MRASALRFPSSRRPLCHRPPISNMCSANCLVGGIDPITGINAARRACRGGFLPVDVRALQQHCGTPVRSLPARCCVRRFGRNGNLRDGCANQREESLKNSDNETLFVVKIDHTINANNSVWYRFQSGHGPAGRLHRSHQCHLQLLLAAAAVHACRRLHAYLPSQSGQPVQSRRELVLEHL